MKTDLCQPAWPDYLKSDSQAAENKNTGRRALQIRPQSFFHSGRFYLEEIHKRGSDRMDPKDHWSRSGWKPILKWEQDFVDAPKIDGPTRSVAALEGAFLFHPDPISGSVLSLVHQSPGTGFLVPPGRKYPAQKAHPHQSPW